MGFYMEGNKGRMIVILLFDGTFGRPNGTLTQSHSILLISIVLLRAYPIA